MNGKIEKLIREKQRIKQRKIIKEKIIISILRILILLIFIILIANPKQKESIKEVKEEKQVSYSDETDILQVEIIETSTREIESKITDWELILINKDNRLPENYKVELETLKNGHKVDKRIAENLTQMLNDAKKEGLNPLIISSYRTHNTQKILYNNKINEFINMGYSQTVSEEKASYWVAIPGTSEHEAGLALDIVATDYQKLNQQQEKTPVQKWLMENCYKYGFILRYPTQKKDITKINYEPWHYRYVGIENAKVIKEMGICLEEYIDYLNGAVDNKYHT